MKENASEDALTSSRTCARCHSLSMAEWISTYTAFGDNVNGVHQIALLEDGLTSAIAFDADFRHKICDAQ
jgi:hypothetical protein